MCRLTQYTYLKILIIFNIPWNFLQFVFSEDETGNAYHVCGIVHNAAKYLPDLLDYMAEKHGTMIVKAGVIGHIGRNSDLETYTMEKYRDEVYIIDQKNSFNMFTTKHL